MSSGSNIDVALAGAQGSFRLDVAISMPMRGVTALFGPSGCGKTTILRCIAGLTRIPGRITVGGTTWQDSTAGMFVPTYQRHIGYVFQEASLFPHLSVRDNLLYGARRARQASPANGADLDDIVDLLGIGHLLDRATPMLSGGERQRVAVGRALLSRPRVLLMDEPLSALDRFTKDEILPYFELLHEALSLPVIYVSHDFAEVERLADTLVLLNKGRVVKAGPLHELQTDTALPLIGAPDASVVLEGRVVSHDCAYQLTRIAIAGGEIVVAGGAGDPGAPRRLRIVASDVSIARAVPLQSTILNCLPARIVAIAQRADAPHATVILALGSGEEESRIVARVTRKSAAALELEPGADVYAQIKSVALIASRGSRAG